MLSAPVKNRGIIAGIRKDVLRKTSFLLVEDLNLAT